MLSRVCTCAYGRAHRSCQRESDKVSFIGNNQFYGVLRRVVTYSMRKRLFLGCVFPLLLWLSFGASACLNNSPSSSAGPRTSTGADDRPELTDEKIQETIVGEFVSGVPAEDGTAEPINWRFDENEPKEFKVLEKQLQGDRATIVIDMKTRSFRAKNQRQLAGQLRLHYELQTGWVTRKWEIVRIENISMKYRMNESSGDEKAREK